MPALLLRTHTWPPLALACPQHDDAVKEESYEALTAVLGGRESTTAGCQAAATLFTLARGTSAYGARLLGCNTWAGAVQLASCPAGMTAAAAAA